jgi:hypothetical protein
MVGSCWLEFHCTSLVEGFFSFLFLFNCHQISRFLLLPYLFSEAAKHDSTCSEGWVAM